MNNKTTIETILEKDNFVFDSIINVNTPTTEELVDEKINHEIQMDMLNCDYDCGHCNS